MLPIKWTERKFQFGYDASYVPFLLRRLEMTYPSLRELVAGCSEEQAAKSPESQWSIKEHIGHLSDLEKLHDGRIDDFIAGVPVLRPADMTNEATNRAGHNSKPLAGLLQEFSETRQAYIARLKETDDRIFEVVSLHPRLRQRVSLADILYFVCEHDLHHLTKIADIVLATPGR